jgi:two-component system OmpR family sensor kinase
MRRGLRARLSTWHIGVAACILLVGAVAGDWALSRTIHNQLDTALTALAETEGAALEMSAADTVHVHEVSADQAPPSFVRLDRLVQIIDLHGTVLARSANLGTAHLPVTEKMLGRLRQHEIVLQTFDDFAEEPIRLVALPISGGHRDYAVEVAGSLDDVQTIVRAGRWLFGLLSFALLGALALTSVVFARKALRPIGQIVTEARQISESNLGARLPHPGGDDEISGLVETLNEMLARIERGLDSQRRFVVDASHELRSPLSRLRAELEVTLRRPRESSEYREALRSCLDEVERLSQLTQELLTLAQLDASEDGRAGATTPLSPLVDAALERIKVPAARRAITIAASAIPPLVVRATPTAVSLAITNVLDNAVKFSPDGGRVTVAVSSEGEEALLIVSDNGPGIPSDELPRLFDRFHRGAAARAAEAHGFGLGLAISKAALESHGGRIDAQPGADGGATFSIRVPLAG